MGLTSPRSFRNKEINEQIADLQRRVLGLEGQEDSMVSSLRAAVVSLNKKLSAKTKELELCEAVLAKTEDSNKLLFTLVKELRGQSDD